MSASEKHIMMAAKLYGARDTLRRLYGEDYQKMTMPFQEAIRKKCKEKGCGELSAMIKLINDVGIGNTTLWFMAAAVEMIELSKCEGVKA